jgi:hypothetical protein
VADIKVLNTPCGTTLIEMIKNSEVAFRLKGVGGMENNVIQDSYKIISINAVSADVAS